MQFTGCRVFRVEHLHEVIDVGGGQPEGLDLGQLGVARNVGNAIPQGGEGIVDRLGSSPLLLVAPAPELAHDRPRRSLVTHHQSRGWPAQVAGQSSKPGQPRTA